jgi:hypothetical protein
VSNLWTQVEDLGTYATSDYAYDAVKTASYLLWGMSGRKFTGITTVTERYTSTYDPLIRAGVSGLTYSPVLIDGSVRNIPTGGFGRYANHDVLADGTSSRSRLRLRGRKVVKIHVLKDQFGEIIDPDQYYLVDSSTIQAIPGAQWDSSNVEVTYTYGSPPPTAGKAAARLLAIELVKLYENDDTCALPQRVTTIARQGVSYTLLDSQDFIDELRTGVYAVDLFLKTANPDKARARSKVFSADTPRARRLIPKPFIYPESVFDLIVTPSGGNVLLYMSEIDAEFIDASNAWTGYVVVSNWTSSISNTYDSAVTIDRTNNTLTVSLTYAQALASLGSKNPGVMDIYVSRPSVGNPAVTEVISVLTSNVSIQYGETTTPIYNLT